MVKKSAKMLGAASAFGLASVIAASPATAEYATSTWISSPICGQTRAELRHPSIDGVHLADINGYEWGKTLNCTSALTMQDIGVALDLWRHNSNGTQSMCGTGDFAHFSNLSSIGYGYPSNLCGSNHSYYTEARGSLEYKGSFFYQNSSPSGSTYSPDVGFP